MRKQQTERVQLLLQKSEEKEEALKKEYREKEEALKSENERALSLLLCENDRQEALLLAKHEEEANELQTERKTSLKLSVQPGQLQIPECPVGSLTKILKTTLTERQKEFMHLPANSLPRSKSQKK